MTASDDPFAEASQTITNHLMDASADGAGNVSFAPSCNIACRADVIRALPFDETYPLAAGEDREWCARLIERGVALVFVPEARVLHEPAPHAASLLEATRAIRPRSLRWHRSRQPGERLQPARFYSALIAKGFATGPSIGALVVLAQLATAMGAARELVEDGWPRQRGEKRLTRHVSHVEPADRGDGRGNVLESGGTARGHRLRRTGDDESPRITFGVVAGSSAADAVPWHRPEPLGPKAFESVAGGWSIGR